MACAAAAAAVVGTATGLAAAAPGAGPASAATGQTGSREFYGGYDDDSPQKSIVGITTTATQLINLSAINAGVQRFKLTGDIGGYETQDDYATVTATFENASGTTLGTAEIGPVNADLRAGLTSLYPQATYGSVRRARRRCWSRSRRPGSAPATASTAGPTT